MTLRFLSPVRLGCLAAGTWLVIACEQDPRSKSDAGSGNGAESSGSGSDAATAGGSQGTSSANGAGDNTGTNTNGAGQNGDGAAPAPNDASTNGGLGDCDAPGLVWKSGAKTNYESYPAPGSDECVKYNGCEYLGQFQACDNTMPESWVMSHDIASVFPLGDLALHRLCIRAGDRRIIVTAIDTCADSDCSGCCSDNRGDADALIDLEKYTNERFGLEDGPVEWADLGPGDASFDGCN